MHILLHLLSHVTVNFYVLTWLGYGAQLLGRNSNLDVSVKVFLDVSRLWVKHITLIMWVALSQSVEGLETKDRGPLKRKEFCLQTVFSLKAAPSTFTGISGVPSCSTDFGLATPPQFVSLSLKINLSTAMPFIPIHLSLSSSLSLSKIYLLVVLFLWRNLTYTGHLKTTSSERWVRAWPFESKSSRG